MTIQEIQDYLNGINNTQYRTVYNQGTETYEVSFMGGKNVIGTFQVLSGVLLAQTKNTKTRLSLEGGKVRISIIENEVERPANLREERSWLKDNFLGHLFLEMHNLNLEQVKVANEW